MTKTKAGILLSFLPAALTAQNTAKQPTALCSAQRPNIVLILADDMGYSDIGCMGSEIQTPNLDALSHQGVLMTNFCNSSKSCPSRASLLTGLYSWKAGMGAMTDTKSQYPEYQGYLNENCATIAELLQQAGYHTYMTGKWHVGDDEAHWPDNRGFENTYMIPNGGGIYFYPPKHDNLSNRPIYRNKVQQQPHLENPDWYSTDGFTDIALEYIANPQNKTAPFFLYVPYVAPHYPLQAKECDIQKYLDVYKAGYEKIRQERFRRQNELGVLEEGYTLSAPSYPKWEKVDQESEARRMAAYAAQIDCIDQNVGRIVQALKDNGLYDNTVIIFLSDNGAVMNHFNKTPDIPYGDPRCYASLGKWQNVSNTPYRYGKGREFEGGIKTPLIISWPAGLKQKDVKVRDYAHITDIMPSCLELAGISYPESYNGHKLQPLDGYSFLPLLEGQHVHQDRTLYFEHMGWKGIREGKWKMNWEKKEMRWELYDLEKDPYENDNIADSHPEIAAMLQQKWEKWAAETGVREWPLDK